MQASDDSEGVVTFEYRTQREGPPDVQQIQKQMAIVAWQPGPNRYVQVPSEVRPSPKTGALKFYSSAKKLAGQLIRPDVPGDGA